MLEEEKNPVSLWAKLRKWLPSQEALDFTAFLIRDGAARYRGTVIAMTLLGITATLLQVTLLGLLFSIFSSGATGNLKLSIFKWKTTIPLGTDAVLSSAILVSLSLGLVAFMVFSVRKLSESLSRKYQMFCVERALILILTSKRLDMPGDESGVEKDLARVARTDSRYTGLCFGRLLYLPVPIISFAAYFSALFYLNAQLTGIIVLFVPLAFAFQMILIRKGAVASNELERLSPEVSKEVAALLGSRSKSTSGVADAEAFLAKTLHEGDMRDFIAARSEMMLIPDRSQMVNEMFAAAAIATVIYTFAFGVGFKVARLTEIIHYLAMLRMLSGSAKQISSISTAMSRYLPQAVRYFHFLRRTWEPEGDASIPAGKPGLNSVVLDSDLHRYNVFQIASVIGNALDDPHLSARPAIVSAEPLNFGPSGLREALGVPKGLTIREVSESCWGNLPWAQDPALETWNCAEATVHLSRTELLRLAIASALAANPTAILLYEKELQKQCKEEIRELLSVRTKIPLLLVHDLPFRAVGHFEEESLITVADGTEVERIPMAQYLAEKKQRQHDLTERRVAARKKLKDEDDEDDE